MPAVYAEFGSCGLGPASSQAVPAMPGALGVVRHPGDPVYLTNITLKNIIIGSRYWIAQESDHSVVLTSGVAASTDVVLSNIPVYETDMLALVRVRNASGSPPYYKPLDSYAYLTKAAVIVFISQEDDD